MSVEEYRKKARQYIKDILSKFAFRRYLVLDALVGDLETNYSKKAEYVENLKIIFVWRDPRDIYATIFFRNAQYMPQNIEDFIKNYNEVVRMLPEMSHKHSLTIRFEDFVFDYDNVASNIMQFLGLKKENHKTPKGFFDPSVSAKNVGRYKTMSHEHKDAIKLIEKHLGEYCYTPKW